MDFTPDESTADLTALTAEIASSISTPERVAELEAAAAPLDANLWQQLAKAGLISSVKGPGGGFYLSPENADSNLSEIINCIDGPDLLHACVLGLPVGGH